MSAPRARRRLVLGALGAAGAAAGFALLAAGVSAAAPILVVSYLALIPAALLA